MRYGSMVFLDATYKITLYDLLLFFLAVRTNVGYQIVGTFMCESETTDAIEEGLKIFADNCPTWKPSFFLTDFHESEIMAVEMVFSDAKVFLCDIHQNRAWDRWVKKKENMIDDGKDVMKWLMRLRNAKNPETFESIMHNFQETDIRTKSNKLQNYITKIWLPEKKRWSKAYHSGIVDIVAGTNNGLETQNNVFKSKFLQKKTTYSLGYADKNLTYSGHYRMYSSDIPTAIQNRPRDFSKHCMQGIELSKSVDRSTIKSIEDVSFIMEADGSKYQVTLGNESLMPFCECDTWYKHQMLCKHMFAVMDNGKGVKWELLSQLYMQSVYCTVDGNTLINL